MPEAHAMSLSWLPVPLAVGQMESGAPEQPWLEVESANEGQASDPSSEGRSTNWISPVLAAAGMAILIHTLIRAYRRSAAKKSDLSKPPRQRIAEVRAEADSRREPVERLMAEATELCQRLATQLDAKAAVLEALIDRAGEAAARLERARGATGTGSVHVPGTPPNPEEPMQRRVFELADQGLSSRDIAARVGQPQGHVELMLNLRRA